MVGAVVVVLWARHAGCIAYRAYAPDEKKERVMTTIPAPLQLPFSIARFAEDKTLKPSADDLSAFRDLMGSFQQMTPTTAMYSVFGGIGSPAPNLNTKPDEVSEDRIKTYIQDRMSARLNTYDAEGLDLQSFSAQGAALPWAMNLNNKDTPAQNMSSLLNMHFDLNTLQMLNMA